MLVLNRESNSSRMHLSPREETRPGTVYAWYYAKPAGTQKKMLFLCFKPSVKSDHKEILSAGLSKSWQPAASGGHSLDWCSWFQFLVLVLRMNQYPPKKRGETSKISKHLHLYLCSMSNTIEKTSILNSTRTKGWSLLYLSRRSCKAES